MAQRREGVRVDEADWEPAEDGPVLEHAPDDAEENMMIMLRTAVSRFRLKHPSEGDREGGAEREKVAVADYEDTSGSGGAAQETGTRSASMVRWFNRRLCRCIALPSITGLLGSWLRAKLQLSYELQKPPRIGVDGKMYPGNPRRLTKLWQLVNSGTRWQRRDAQAEHGDSEKQERAAVEREDAPPEPIEVMLTLRPQALLRRARQRFVTWLLAVAFAAVYTFYSIHELNDPLIYRMKQRVMDTVCGGTDGAGMPGDDGGENMRVASVSGSDGERGPIKQAADFCPWLRNALVPRAYEGCVVVWHPTILFSCFLVLLLYSSRQLLYAFIVAVTSRCMVLTGVRQAPCGATTRAPSGARVISWTVAPSSWGDCVSRSCVQSMGRNFAAWQAQNLCSVPFSIRRDRATRVVQTQTS